MRKIPTPFTDPTPLFRHGGDSPGLLDFSASINPLGPPQSVLRAIREGLADIAHYPDPHCRELTNRLAAHHGVDPSQIVVGNGSNELIYAIARAFRPMRVAIAEPTYTEYLRASLLVGADVEHWLADTENDFELRPFDVKGVDLVWLCHPNNPTGRLWQVSEAAEWMIRNPRTLFVVDEAFLPLCIKTEENNDDWSRFGFSCCETIGNVVTLHSLTKTYALPGLRLGYAMASPEVAQRIQNELPPWSVNILAQRAGEAVRADAEFRGRTAVWLSSPETRSFERNLAAVSPRLHVFPSNANFVLARLERMTAKELADCLAQRGIVIRDAANFVGLDERYFRVAIRTAPENQRLFDELRSIPQD